MSDMFHEAIPDGYVRRVFDVMAAASQHQFQVLTKRHGRLGQLARHLPWPENVWMGVTIENDRWVERADVLRQVPAAVRFVSAEPLLGPLPHLNLDGLDWLIAGGESGPGRRPAKAEWFRDLRDRCQEAGVSFFFKQWGGRFPKASGRELDGEIWNEYPEPRSSLQVPQTNLPGLVSSADRLLPEVDPSLIA